MKQPKFTNILFVSIENQGTRDEFRDTHLNLADCAEMGVSKRVAVYILDHVADVTGDFKVVHHKSRRLP